MLELLFFFFKQKTAYEMRISDWSSDVCSSDLDRSDGDPMSPHLFWGKISLNQAGEILDSHPVESHSIDVAAVVLQLLSERNTQIGRASCRERVCQYV